MAQALQHPASALIAQLSTTCTADIHSPNPPSGSARSHAIVSISLSPGWKFRSRVIQGRGAAQYKISIRVSSSRKGMNSVRNLQGHALKSMDAARAKLKQAVTDVER